MQIELLPEAIVQDFKKWTEKKSAQVDKAVRNRTKEALDDVVSASPVRKRVPKSGVIRTDGEIKDNYQPGAYKKGWMKYVSTARAGRTQGYVRNKTNFQLVHLLELGHKARDGSQVNAIEHVNPAEERAREGLDRDIDRILGED